MNAVKETFFKELDKKTGWGKNDIKTLYREVLNVEMEKAFMTLVKKETETGPETTPASDA
jgi:hypothetical protein